MKITIINGPNLNLLGTREKKIYGDQNFESYFEQLKTIFKGHELSYFQSNHEGELIEKIQKIGYSEDGIVFNPAGYSHTSVALSDAISAISTPVIEVHISNIHAREEFRHHSYMSAVCTGVIAGLGLKGYELAISYFLTS